MGIFMRIYHYLFGFFTVSVTEEQKASLINLFLKEKIAAYPQKDGTFLLGAEYRKRVEALFKKIGQEAKISERKGLPGFLCRYRSRVGLFIGGVTVCLLLTLASRVVWRVEVSGNETVSDSEIIENLREIGFGEGSYISRSDFVDLSASLRLKHPEIAHADIYCVGTVAHVRIAEAQMPHRDESANLPTHLVASRDAIIESFNVKHGSTVAECGQLVKKGDMLVSGIVTGAHGDVLLHADGKVYGRVSDEIVIEIPYKQTKEIVEGYKKGKKTLFFFGKAINIRKNAGNLPTTYGTIVEREDWVLPGDIRLPISFVEEKTVLLKTEEVTLSCSEALRLAYARLGTEITARTQDGYLISKSVSAAATDDACILKCTVSYVTSISEDKPIELLE